MSNEAPLTATRGDNGGRSWWKRVVTKVKEKLSIFSSLSAVIKTGRKEIIRD